MSPDGTTVTHRLLVTSPTIGLALQFERVSDRHPVRAGFCCAVFGLPAADGRPTVISALDIESSRGWELRTSGLWSEQVCEQHNVHWSYGLEAFALAIDEPDELLRRGYGLRLPLGWELDFLADDQTAGHNGDDQHGSVEGLVLGPDGEMPIEGRARRSSWVGQPPARSAITDLTHGGGHDGPVLLPTMTGPWAVCW